MGGVDVWTLKRRIISGQAKKTKNIWVMTLIFLTRNWVIERFFWFVWWEGGLWLCLCCNKSIIVSTIPCGPVWCPPYNGLRNDSQTFVHIDDLRPKVMWYGIDLLCLCNVPYSHKNYMRICYVWVNQWWYIKNILII